MGNKMSLELKEGRPCIEIGESLVRDFQDRIFSTDKAMSGFVKAIDSMEAACEELDRKLRPRVNVTKEKKDENCDLNDEQLAAKLLWTIKECVSDHKFVVLECLSKLIKLIIETGSEYVDDPPDLSIDKYRQSHKVEDKPYYDTRIQMLLKDVDLLKQKYKLEKEQVEDYKAKELNFSKLQKKYQARIDELQKNVDEISLENAKLDESLLRMKEKQDDHDIVNSEMKTEMKSSPMFLETKLENMQRDMELMSLKYKMEKEKVDSLNNKEEIFSKETARYLKRIGELDNEVDTLISMNNDLDVKIRSAQQEVENQSIEIDILKRREKIANQYHKEMKYKAEEYKAKTEDFFGEICRLVEDISPKHIGNIHDKVDIHKNDATQQQDIDSKNCGRIQNFNSDGAEVQMQIIKCHLSHIKETHELHRHDAGEEVDERTRKMKEEENGKEKVISEVKILREANLQLNLELKALKENQVMNVQVYSMYGSKACPREYVLLSLLETGMRINSVELRIEELSSPTKAHPGIPLLIFFVNSYSYLYWSESSANIMAKFELTEKMALVTFHRRNKNDLPTDGIKEEYSEKLGGSFDFGLRYNSADYCFDESSLNAIIAFIKINNPERKDQSEGNTYLGR